MNLEESMYSIEKREELYDEDYGDCTRLHFAEGFVIDIYYRRGDRDLAENTVGIFTKETINA